ncbi:MAG: hypothetical protein AB1512_19405 [Thermodesulfobacteriota bacterium]
MCLALLVGAVLLAPAAQGEKGTQESACRDNILEEIRQIEFSEIQYNVPCDPYYGFRPGTIPVLLSAPHGARHYRTGESRWKGEDEYTASIAIRLGELTGAHVVYVKNRAPEDPNHDVRSAYEDFVEKIVKEHGILFLIDLHGADEARPFKIDVGILEEETERSSCPTFKKTIEECFSGFQGNLFNQRFPARGSGTITHFARKKLGIEAAQFEINARYRIVERKPDSTCARDNRKPHFRARPEDVLEFLGRMERMILAVHVRIRECSLGPTGG